ncbi:MAG: AgmX/PglI C-terminal domain-containing protein [Archangium sp.]|nr:AgmX/PglI C-terminal domain-containing protein [Archangium sp.]
MSAQPTVLQVVIMRDGLLVGTEVFVPGQYTLGSADGSDLKLDDPGVAAQHATLYFQNGRAAIQDGGRGLTFVNGHKVSACEVRAVDEIACGPFTLKIRVMGQKPVAKPGPPPEVAALLGGSPPPPAAPPAAAKPPAPAPRAVAPAPVPPPQQPARGNPAPSTVVSNRRSAAALEPASARAPHLRPVPSEEAETRTESVALGSELLEMPTAQRNAPEEDHLTMPLPMPAAEAHQAATVQARAHQPSAPAPAPASHAKAAPQPQKQTAPQRGHAPAKAIPQSNKNFSPSIPSANEGKGRPHLFVELYWGDTRKYANSYKTIDQKKKLIAGPDDNAALPLFGFELQEPAFVFAEQKADLFRVYVPPGAAVERRAQDGKFYPVQVETLETAPDSRRCVTLGTGHAVRFTTGRDVLLMAYVQPAIPKPFVNPLKGLPWLMLAILSLFTSAFGAFVFYFAEMPAEADFTGKTLSPVAVKLIAPPKPEEKKKLEEKVEKIKKVEKKKEEPKIAKELPKPVPQETKKALKSIEKLAAAGPAMKDLLAAVDKLGSGPGAKNAKNDFKLSGLIGKAPIANAGIGTFGLGGGGAGGMGIKGAELLRGKGGGGIGALGAGNIGKGSVAGTVTRAATRNIGAQGTIDKEAVAKVINSHLHEVSSCYERALLKTPGLAGKIVLEWQITTSGSVGYAKTKSSSMQSAAVESCILASLKTWRFPPAKGAGVVITYPFMFNSVGY